MPPAVTPHHVPGDTSGDRHCPPTATVSPSPPAPQAQPKALLTMPLPRRATHVPRVESPPPQDPTHALAPPNPPNSGCSPGSPARAGANGGEGSRRCRWAAGLSPARAPQREFLLFPGTQRWPRALGGFPGGAGGGSGPRAAASPGAAVIHSARPRPLGLKFLRLGGSRSLTFLGNFNKNSSEASKKQDDGKRHCLGSLPLSFFIVFFNLCSPWCCPTPRSPTRCHPPPRAHGAPRATRVSPATLRAPFLAGSGVPSPHSWGRATCGDSGLATTRTCCPGGL